MQKIKYLLLIPVIAFSCQEVHVPKPKGYNRFDLPAHEYKKLEEEHPYQFQISKHAETSPHKSAAAEPHWIDIKYPELNATIEITYKDLSTEKNGLTGILTDAHKLTNKHNIKAYSIDEKVIKTPKGYTATIFELEGEVPSQFQFFITDSTNHFLRGALYFPTSTKNDPLSPAIEYIKTDIVNLLNTLEWNEM